MSLNCIGYKRLTISLMLVHCTFHFVFLGFIKTDPSNLKLIPSSSPIIFHPELLNRSTCRQSRLQSLQTGHPDRSLVCCASCLRSSKKIRKMAEAPNQDGLFPETEVSQGHQGHQGLPQTVPQVSCSHILVIVTLSINGRLVTVVTDLTDCCNI